MITKRSFHRLRMIVSSLRLIPHLIIMLSTKNIEVVKADLSRWAEAVHMNEPRTLGDFVVLFITFMSFYPEFRNVFHLRVGRILWPFLWLCPRLGFLSIDSPNVGPGLYIQHGECTFVSAESIGANCWIGRQVVIGYSNDTDRPTIGHNVRIYAGAKIIGKINIGDNATIGLNTVVIDNVAPGATVLGVPARVVWTAKPPSVVSDKTGL
jgi:serine O-acetyltransferase